MKTLLLIIGLGFTLSLNAASWPGFRGAQASGVVEGFSLSTNWDGATGKGIKWKTVVPGLGHSSPVVASNRIYLTTAINPSGSPELRLGLYGDIKPVEEATAHQFKVLCYDLEKGNLLWEKTAREAVPKIKRHPKASHSNSSPATDGRHVVAFFGSEGLYCYSSDGALLWEKDFGTLDSGFFRVPSAQWGFASSPVIHGNAVLVQCDVQTNSFVAAFDLKTGAELWRTARADYPTWSSPTVVESGGTAQVVLNGYKHAGAYDYKTGRELWKIVGGGDIPVPTPIMAERLIFLTSAHGPMSPIYAVKPSAAGDITLKAGATNSAHIAWSVPRKGNYMQTPLVYRGLLYACNDLGVVSCYDAKTGLLHYSERLTKGGTGFTSSPVAGDGKIYFTDEQGTTHILLAGEKLNPLGKNELGETFMSTPAIADGVLLMRARQHLFAIRAGR